VRDGARSARLEHRGIRSIFSFFRSRTKLFLLLCTSIELVQVLFSSIKMHPDANDMGASHYKARISVPTVVNLRIIDVDHSTLHAQTHTVMGIILKSLYLPKLFNRTLISCSQDSLHSSRFRTLRTCLRAGTPVIHIEAVPGLP